MMASFRFQPLRIGSTTRTDCCREAKFSANPFGVLRPDLHESSIFYDICRRNQNLRPARPHGHRKCNQEAREIVRSDALMFELAPDKGRNVVAIFNRKDVRVHTVRTVTRLGVRSDDPIAETRR